jgi:hypothetical protein
MTRPNERRLKRLPAPWFGAGDKNEHTDLEYLDKDFTHN